MDVSLFAPPAFFRRQRRVYVASELHRRLVVIAAMVAIVVMMGRRRIVREHDLANAMTIAAFVGMSRGARNDAKQRQSKSQEPGQEATKQDHRGILNARFLPLCEGSSLCEYLPSRNGARGFPQRNSSRIALRWQPTPGNAVTLHATCADAAGRH